MEVLCYVPETNCEGDSSPLLFSVCYNLKCSNVGGWVALLSPLSVGSFVLLLPKASVAVLRTFDTSYWSCSLY